MFATAAAIVVRQKKNAKHPPTASIQSPPSQSSFIIHYPSLSLPHTTSKYIPPFLLRSFFHLVQTDAALASVSEYPMTNVAGCRTRQILLARTRGGRLRRALPRRTPALCYYYDRWGGAEYAVGTDGAVRKDVSYASIIVETVVSIYSQVEYLTKHSLTFPKAHNKHVCRGETKPSRTVECD